MEPAFNSDEAKKFLSAREERERETQEQERTLLFQKVISILKKEFQETNVEVFLVGSIIRPYKFTSRSDVDIVLKNFEGERFDVWTKLEELIGRNVEIILFEKCSFQEFVNSEGFKVR